MDYYLDAKKESEGLNSQDCKAIGELLTLLSKWSDSVDHDLYVCGGIQIAFKEDSSIQFGTIAHNFCGQLVFFKNQETKK